MAKTTGLHECEAALERLLKNTPHVGSHVGVTEVDITPAMVSVEAGYDKGYLKRSRYSHKPLIARIDSLKKSPRGGDRVKLKKAERKCKQLQAEQKMNGELMDRLFTQNLMLLQRVKELENELSRYTNVVTL
ncbi:hypothetical protein BOW53_08035 [Solemya pervernicosa gill symbiont]|uniref:Uncharacterized protein n=1 Tax=Solemya pervernicosa gill symbiont TaxID=642797 RepID=A0A1T2L5H1_9GAMM|nr:hypothetical protein [Solemya pervernicosa gill symbiont]OOZ40314.1 hypothetical protein BOW53_08035 [Solemya pervernicosa gill symbiont]